MTKCKNCKKDFLLIEGPQYCPECIDTFYILSLTEGWVKREKPWIPNTDYKKKLQGITHRGKNKVKE